MIYSVQDTVIKLKHAKKLTQIPISVKMLYKIPPQNDIYEAPKRGLVLLLTFSGE